MSASAGRVTILGSGTSHGVPVIGCRCDVCRSPNPRDTRLRPSILLELDGGPNVLVDATPDLRQQALTHGVERVDAILFTHGHADHVMGLDDVRRYNVLQKAGIPCYGDRRTMAELRRVFAYVFESNEPGGGRPQIELVPIAGRFSLGRHEIIPVPVLHGHRQILGFRVGGFAYVTDCNAIPDGSWELLQGLDVLVLDALRHRPHPTHFTVAEAVDVARRLAPRQVYFTHICHDLGHDLTNAALPAGMALAWDGLRLDIAAG